MRAALRGFYGPKKDRLQTRAHFDALSGCENETSTATGPASSILEKHCRILGVDLVPEAETGIASLEMDLETLRVDLGGKPKFEDRRVVTANRAAHESWTRRKHRIRRVGDAFQISGHALTTFCEHHRGL
jgi:hypothetical protein